MHAVRFRVRRSLWGAVLLPALTVALVAGWPLTGARAQDETDEDAVAQADGSDSEREQRREEEEARLRRERLALDPSELSLSEAQDEFNRRIEFSPDAPMTFVQIGGSDLQDLARNPIVRNGRGLSSIRFGAGGGDFDEPVRVMVRGAGQDSAATNFEPGLQTYVDDVFLPFTTGAILSLIDTESIEVKRGPQPSTGGKNGIGGALRVRSVQPQPELGLNTTVTAGNLGTLRSETSLNIPLAIGPLKERAFMRFSFASRRDDGFLENIPTGTESGNDDLLGGRVALRLLPTENSEVNISWDVSRQEQMLTAGQCRDVAPFARNRALLDTVFQFDQRCQAASMLDENSILTDGLRELQAEEEGFTASADIELGEWLLTSITGWRRLNLNSGTGDFDDTDARITLADPTITEREARSQEFRLAGSFFDQRLRFLTGVQYFEESGNVSGGFVKFPGVDFDQSVGPDDAGQSVVGLTREQAGQVLADLGADPSSLDRVRVERDEDGRILLSRIRRIDRLSTSLAAFSNANGIALGPDGRPTLSALDAASSGIVAQLLSRDDASAQFVDESLTRSYAGFLDTTFEVTPRLTLGAGVRYTIEEKEERTLSRRRFARAVAEPAMMVDDGQDGMMVDAGTPVDPDAPMDAMEEMSDPLDPFDTQRRFDERRVALVTPSADLTFRLSENITLTGRYARGFTSGELGNTDDDKPEILDTYSVGMSSRWFDDRLLFNVTGYRSVYDNIQVGVSITDEIGQNVARRINTAKGVITGLDMDFQTSLNTRLGSFDLGGGLGLINAEYEEFTSDVDVAQRTEGCVGAGLSSCPGVFAEVSEDVLRLREGAELPDDIDFDNIPEDLLDTPGGVPLEFRRNRILGAFGDGIDRAAGLGQRRNVDRSDLEFANTPSVSYNLFMRYQVDVPERGSLTAVSTWYHQNETALNLFNTVKQEGYGVLDFALSWVHPNGKFVVGAYMNNVLDRRYLEGASDSQDFDGAESVFFSRPRTYGIQVGYQFGGF